MQDTMVGLVFGTAIVGLYFRPRWLHDWHVAAGGGFLCWLLGPLSVRDGLEMLEDSLPILAFFLGLMLLAAGAETSGLYARAAGFLGAHSGGRRLAVFVLALGAALTAVLSNDATPLVLTPAVFVLAQRQQRSVGPEAIAIPFVANGASLLFPVSNPVNLLLFERFDMTLGGYIREITPAAFAGGAVLALLTLRARTSGATRLPPVAVRAVHAPRPPKPPHPAYQVWAVAVTAALLPAYVVASVAGWPLGAVTLAGGGALLAAGVFSRSVSFGDYRRHVSPGLLVFVAGLMVMVESARVVGLLDWSGDAMTFLAERPEFVAIAGAALLAAVLSNIVNNWPAALLLAAAIGLAPEAGQAPLIVGTLIGCTIGANFTIVGSLSSVFWLTLMRQHGLSFSPWEFARRAWWPTAAGVAVACGVAAVL